MIRYLDIREILLGADITVLRAEISGIEVADEADARTKLAIYAPCFEGLEYEAFYHEHFHAEDPADSKPCEFTRLN